MDCKLTFTKPRRFAGFTLVELMISMGIGGMVLAVVTALTFFSARSFAAMTNYADLSNQSRNALDRITSDVRGCKRIYETSSATHLVLKDHDNQILKYSFNRQTRILTRVKQHSNGTSTSEPVLTECDSFRYNMFSRNPVNGTYNQFPASSSTTCKLVQVNWTCSRKILGRKENTISVQTAKVVMRAQKARI